MFKRYFMFLMIFVIFTGCSDPDSNNSNNVNNSNNTNNINNSNNTNKIPPDFMTFPAVVQLVSDGDTIHVEYLGRSIKIRFKGVNAPEIAHNGTPAEPFGVDAMDFVKSHSPVGSFVGLEFDDDRCGSENPPASCFDVYDRMLAYIRTEENQDLGAQLLVNGYAEVYTAAEFNRKTVYLQYQQQAVDAQVGIWSD